MIQPVIATTEHSRGSLIANFSSTLPHGFLTAWPAKYFALILMGVVELVGCSTTPKPFIRNVELGSVHAVSLDIKQRMVFESERTLSPTPAGRIPQPPAGGTSVPPPAKGTDVTQTIICPEPSPDAISAATASINLSAAGAEKALSNLSFGSSQSENAGFVGLRTQSIQLLRDQLTHLCLGYMNGALDANAYYLLIRRQQRLTLGLLAVEQLTGAVVAQAQIIAAPNQPSQTPPGGKGTTPPAGSGTTPPADKGATPPAGTGTKSPKGSTAPAGSGTTPSEGSGSTPPIANGSAPKSEPYSVQIESSPGQPTHARGSERDVYMNDARIQNAVARVPNSLGASGQSIRGYEEDDSRQRIIAGEFIKTAATQPTPPAGTTQPTPSASIGSTPAKQPPSTQSQTATPQKPAQPQTTPKKTTTPGQPQTPGQQTPGQTPGQQQPAQLFAAQQAAAQLGVVVQGIVNDVLTQGFEEEECLSLIPQLQSVAFQSGNEVTDWALEYCKAVFQAKISSSVSTGPATGTVPVSNDSTQKSGGKTPSASSAPAAGGVTLEWKEQLPSDKSLGLQLEAQGYSALEAFNYAAAAKDFTGANAKYPGLGNAQELAALLSSIANKDIEECQGLNLIIRRFSWRLPSSTSVTIRGKMRALNCKVTGSVL